MYCLCIFLLLVFSALCESLHKTCQVPAFTKNVGKFRRNTIRKSEIPHVEEVESKSNKTFPIKRSYGEFKLSENSNPFDFKRIMRKPSEKRSDQTQSSFGKLIKDYFSKVGWRSSADRLSLAPQGGNFLNSKVDSFAPAGDKIKFANIDFKNRIDGNLARFSEGSRNYSDGPFQLPDTGKINTQIKDLISQSPFAKPMTAESSQGLNVNSPSSPVTIGICDDLDNPSSNSINLKILLNKNISDVFSLSKPDLPPRSSAFSNLGSKKPDLNPFQVVSKGTKLGHKISDVHTGDKLDEKLFEKSSNEISDDYLKNKISSVISANDDGQIKSARRLFDVIQSQNPLDLLNIPLLMNSFKFDSGGITNKYSDLNVVGSSTVTSVNELEDPDLPAVTTEKGLVTDLPPKNDEDFLANALNKKLFDLTISKPLSHITNKNHSLENSCLPWGALSNILQQGFPNMPLVVIPLNRIRFSSMMSNPDKNVFDIHYNNGEINKTLEPLAEEMRKVFTYQDLFSKPFNTFNMKELIDYGTTLEKSNAKTEATVKFLNVPSVKKADDLGFQKRVEDFLKLSRLNLTDFHRKIDVLQKNPSEEEYIHLKDLTVVSNTSHLTQEAKKSKLYDHAQSILPLLKITANMALSKYSNIPIQGKFPNVEKKTSNNYIQAKEDARTNQVETNRTASTSSVPQENVSTLKEEAFSDTNITVSTETFLDKQWSQSETLGLDRNLPNDGFTDSPSISISADNQRNESDIVYPTAEPLSAMMESVANNFIIQSIKDFEQSLKSKPKSLSYENSTPNSIEVKDSNSTLVENPNKLNLEDTGINLNETTLLGEQTASSTNESSITVNLHENHPYSNEKEKSTVLTQNENSNLKSSLGDISQNKLEESSLKKNVNDTSIDSDLNNFLPSAASNKPGDVNVAFTKNLSLTSDENKSNLALVKELVSEMLNSENKDRVNCLKSSALQAFANSNQSPLEMSEVNENSPIVSDENLRVTTTTSVLNNEAKIKENDEHWEVENPLSGNASYYISHKNKQNLDGFSSKNIKNEYLQIPAVLVEILNRIELLSSLENNSYSGYNMLFLPLQENKTGLYKEYESTTESHSYRSSAPSSTKKETQMPAFATTERSLKNCTDNIFQVVTLDKNGDMLVGETVAMSASGTTPLPDVCAFNILSQCKDGGKSMTAYEDGNLHKSSSNPHNNRPIILLAIDPLKAWESQSPIDHKATRQHMPLGIIIKSTSVISRPELNETMTKGSSVLIGEPPQNIAELKCTTPGSGEWKCKEVTLFPIYPMYPVYPLKPIIASNDTSTLSVNSS